MTTYRHPGRETKPEQAVADQQQPLALEAEFDGVRRPQAPSSAAPCDPERYWDIYSYGTD